MIRTLLRLRAEILRALGTQQPDRHGEEPHGLQFHELPARPECRAPMSKIQSNFGELFSDTQANASVGAAILLGVLFAAVVVGVSQVGENVKASLVQTETKLGRSASLDARASTTPAADTLTNEDGAPRSPIIEIAAVASVAAAAMRYGLR